MKNIISLQDTIAIYTKLFGSIHEKIRNTATTKPEARLNNLKLKRSNFGKKYP